MGKFVSARLGQQATGNHPDPELLSAFSENSLAQAERATLLQHLAVCSACRETLYLAIPETGEEQRSVVAAPPRTRFAWRWATLAASVVIIGTVIVGNRDVFTHHPQQNVAPPHMANYSPPASPAAPEVTHESDARASRLQGAEARVKTRPEAKHMTAKPQASMSFDKSDEVHIAAAPAPMADQKVAGNQVQPAAQGQLQQYGGSQKAETQTRQLLVAPSQNFDTMSAANRPAAFSWSLSPTGQPQRSSDSGQSWHVIPVENGPFLAIKSVGKDVWIGGRAGALYHSQDTGQNWVKVEPAYGKRTLDSDITEINFRDPSNGSLTTVNGEIWSTSDGGKNWQLK